MSRPGLVINDSWQNKFSAYSSAVHKAIVMINVAFLATLQIVTQHSSISLLTVSIYFGILIIYAVLRVGETITVQLRPAGLVARFVGHTSHFFGALTPIGLISVVSVEFACVLALLLFLWISIVVFTELKKNKSRTGLSQLPVCIRYDIQPV